MSLIKDVWYATRELMCIWGHPTQSSLRKSWNQRVLLIKVDRCDSMMKELHSIGGLTICEVLKGLLVEQGKAKQHFIILPHSSL